MFKNRFVVSLFLSMLVAVIGCQSKTTRENALVKIGGKVFSNDDYALFSDMMRIYPHPFAPTYPADRAQITIMVESEALYARIPGSFKSRITKSADWKWKQNYFAGQLYMIDVLNNNMGIAEQDIKRYYASHRSSFLDSVSGSESAPMDSSSQTPTVARPDSVRQKELSEVREDIIKELFIQQFPPDSAWLRESFGDSLPDSTIIKERWLTTQRNELQRVSPDFFLTRTYQELYKNTLPDTMEAWALQSGFIDSSDVNVILGWIPEDRRERFAEDEESRKGLMRWMIRWKVFAKKAQQSGYTKLATTKQKLLWAQKVETVTRYVNEELAPKVAATTQVDSALALYSYWDHQGRVVLPPDSSSLAFELRRIHNEMVTTALTAKIAEYRTKAKVSFLQSDYADQRNANAAQLLAQAEAARDSGDEGSSQSLYRTLASDLPHTAEGQAAMAELAKNLSENNRYSEAIDMYRKHLFLAGDKANRCNVFFMIGFIYDEYLANPQLAEINYKWVLKNTPDCELIDDAEFMMLHLDEPMVRIEDLSAEAQRQGRPIASADTATAPANGQ